MAKEKFSSKIHFVGPFTILTLRPTVFYDTFRYIYCVSPAPNPVPMPQLSSELPVDYHIPHHHISQICPKMRPKKDGFPFFCTYCVLMLSKIKFLSNSNIRKFFLPPLSFSFQFCISLLLLYIYSIETHLNTCARVICCIYCTVGLWASKVCVIGFLHPNPGLGSNQKLEYRYIHIYRKVYSK